MYSSGGRVAVQGLASTPVGAVKLAYTQDSGDNLAIIFANNGTPSIATSWKTSLDPKCSNPDFTIGIPSVMDTFDCVDATVTSQAFGQAGSTFFNIVMLNNGILSMSNPMPFIKPGNYVNYPSVIDVDLTLTP